MSRRTEQLAPRCGAPRWCQARRLALALTTEEMRVALDAIPEPMGSRILRSIGLQPKSKSRRTPELVLARIANMAPGSLHFLTWVLVAVPIESLADMADGQEQESVAAADEVNMGELLLRGGGLTRGAERWPRSILALAVEGLWDQDYLTLEDRDELLAFLAAQTRLLSPSHPPLTGRSRRRNQTLRRRARVERLLASRWLFLRCPNQI